MLWIRGPVLTGQPHCFQNGGNHPPQHYPTFCQCQGQLYHTRNIVAGKIVDDILTFRTLLGTDVLGVFKLWGLLVETALMFTPLR